MFGSSPRAGCSSQRTSDAHYRADVASEKMLCFSGELNWIHVFSLTLPSPKGLGKRSEKWCEQRPGSESYYPRGGWHWLDW